jgi:hypothetical protein
MQARLNKPPARAMRLDGLAQLGDGVGWVHERESLSVGRRVASQHGGPQVRQAATGLDYGRFAVWQINENFLFF